MTGVQFWPLGSVGPLGGALQQTCGQLVDPTDEARRQPKP